MCLSTDIGIPNPGFDYNEPTFVIPVKSGKCLQLRFMSRFSENNHTSALLPNLWATKVEFRQYFIGTFMKFTNDFKRKQSINRTTNFFSTLK